MNKTQIMAHNIQLPLSVEFISQPKRWEACTLTIEGFAETVLRARNAKIKSGVQRNDVVFSLSPLKQSRSSEILGFCNDKLYFDSPQLKWSDALGYLGLQENYARGDAIALDTSG